MRVNARKRGRQRQLGSGDALVAIYQKRIFPAPIFAGVRRILILSRFPAYHPILADRPVENSVLCPRNVHTLANNYVMLALVLLVGTWALLKYASVAKIPLVGPVLIRITIADGAVAKFVATYYPVVNIPARGHAMRDYVVLARSL